MRNIIEGLLIVSTQASIMVVAVLLLRLFIKKTYKVFTYFMWIVILLRLCVPIQFESPFGIIEAKEKTAIETPVDVPEYNQGLQDDLGTHNTVTVAPEVKPEVKPSVTPPVKPNAVPDTTPSISEGETSELTKTLFVLTKEQIVAIVWLVGAIIVATLAAVQVILLRRRVGFAIHVEDNIWETDNINTAFVIGIFRPRIYIPSSLNAKEREHILMHEKMHIRHGDNIVRVVMLLVNVFYWWNPLVWVATHLMKKDMEMFCDEAVIKKMDNATQGAYLKTLLNFSAKNSGIIPVMSFGETNTEVRIRHIMNLKRPKFYIFVALIVFVLVGVVGCVSVARTNEETTTQAPTTKEPEDNTDKVETGEQQSTEPEEKPDEPMSKEDLYGYYVNEDKNKYIIISSPYLTVFDLSKTSANLSPDNYTDGVMKYFTDSYVDNQYAYYQEYDYEWYELHITDGKVLKFGGEEYKYVEEDKVTYSVNSTGYPQYDEIISILVENSDNLSFDACEKHNVSYAWATPATYINGGFYLIDLDGDGIEEMLLGENGCGAWAGTIYDIYTIKNGKAVSICSGGHRDRFNLCVGNIIGNDGSGGASNGIYYFYEFINGELVLKKGILFDSDYDDENPWFVCDENFDPSTGIPISDVDAKTYINSNLIIPIEFKLFTTPEFDMQ